MFSLHDRVALITGAGRGIGRAIAEALAARGAHVALAARTESELDDVVAAIAQAGGRAIAFSADLSQPKVPGQLAHAAAAQLGPIDILVNNAGIGSSADPKPVIDFDDAFWDLTLTLNLTTPYRLCKAVLPAMTSRHWGRIINIASINSKMPSMHAAAYTASKHGVVGLTKALALETAAQGITVNAICPGPVHTLMNDKRLEYDAQRRGTSVAEIEKTITPIGGRLEPTDIAPLAVYLASDEARTVTGQAWNIDGGICMAG
jgi:NAD(P)-dependent dehydrogenase (short-subunit alcohol dehydrogenase family)